MTARAAARMYAALLGHLDGVRLVSRERLHVMAATAFSGLDQVMGLADVVGAGLQPGASRSPPSSPPT